MAIVQIDGFKFLDGLSSEYIVIEGDRINEYIEYIKKKKIEAVYLCDIWYSKTEIDFLKECNFIKKLNINSEYIYNLDGLKYLKNLKELVLYAPKGKVDLKSYEYLEKLSVDYNKNIVGIENLKALKKLSLYKYKPRSRNLVKIGSLDSLKELEIIGSTIDSLDGCENLSKLERLQLSYLNNLCFIDRLEKIKNSLKVLEINNCKKINNFDFVTCLVNLENLSYNECGEIDTIEFIDKMPNLKRFVFMGTNVLDGNMKPCSRLQYVAFTNKKHYSNKCSEFNENF